VLKTAADLPAVAAEVDAGLVEVACAFDHLVDVTPVDVEDARAAFRAAGCREEPRFHYRPLTIDPAGLRQRLARLPLADVEDPALSALFDAKRRELECELRLVEQRNTPAFLDTSLELYGGLEPELVATAGALLDRARQKASPRDRRAPVGALAFARRAGEEIAYYRSQWPAVHATVVVRDDLPGVMVSDGQLLVGRRLTLEPGRVEALIHHEVGTHVVTHENGRAQPLELLGVGLPGADETQEGLAVLAEFLVGGLTPARLALLAARVVAVDRLLTGEPFAGTFHRLHRHHRFPPGPAFRVVMRVYRSGGLTKDAIYLRGLERLLSHLGAGGSLEPLLVGKLDLLHVPVVEELAGCGLLGPPPLRPRWLSHPRAAEGLAQLQAGLSIGELWQEVCR
jgi:uncharacterized protein (TIGR02421 family)